MNYTYTITRETLEDVLKGGQLTIAAYKTEMLPSIGDRVYLNNFEEVFTIDDVTPIKDDDALLAAYQVDEAKKPYFLGFFGLTLRLLFDDFDIVSIRDLHEDDSRADEIGQTAEDVVSMLSDFKAELKIAEARNEGRAKLSDADVDRIIHEAGKEAREELYGDILPAVFKEQIVYSENGQTTEVYYNPVILYINEFAPLAMMIFYREVPKGGDNLGPIEAIESAYIDRDFARKCGLTLEDVQYLLDELFDRTMLEFDPETASAVMGNPTITVLASQVEYYDDLIEQNDWEATGDIGFGYRIFN